jgi:hypothetical protein
MLEKKRLFKLCRIKKKSKSEHLQDSVNDLNPDTTVQFRNTDFHLYGKWLLGQLMKSLPELAVPLGLGLRPDDRHPALEPFIVMSSAIRTILGMLYRGHIIIRIYPHGSATPQTTHLSSTDLSTVLSDPLFL